MICETFRELNVLQQRNLVGNLILLVQRSNTACMAAIKLVEAGEESGFLAGVKMLLPEVEEPVHGGNLPLNEKEEVMP